MFVRMTIFVLCLFLSGAAVAGENGSAAVHLHYPPGCVDENGSRMEITIQPDAGGPARTIIASMGQDADLTVLPGRPDGTTRITINGITGILKEMTLSGDSALTIISIEKGAIASVGLPDNVKYSGMSPDGRIMYLSLESLKLFFEVEQKKIFRIEQVGLSSTPGAQLSVCGKPEGSNYSGPILSDRGEIYYIGYDIAGGGRSSVYKQNPVTCKITRLVQFLGSPPKPVIMDDKLFSSDIGYDSCRPFVVVDLASGLKLDTGSCGGIVPIGPHELLYCAEGGMIVNTTTLQRRKVDVKHCPGKTGDLLPHPLPGYYIYLSWTLC